MMPSARRLASWCWSHWYAVAALAAVLATLDCDLQWVPADWALFEAHGDALLHGSFDRVFDDPVVQTGPLALALVAVLGSAVRVLHLPAAPSEVAAMTAISAGCCVTVVRRVLAPTSADDTARGAGLLLATAYAVGVGAVGMDLAHPTHALIGLLWLLTALEARAGRGTRAGLLLGLATAFDSWALMGVGLLLLAQGRDRLRAAAACLAVTALSWGPEVASGSFHMGEFDWDARRGSLPALLLGLGTPVPWSYRLAQGGLAIAAGAGLALLLRRSPHAVWVAPAAVVAVRVALDPLQAAYYSDPAVYLLVAGVAALAIARDRRVLLAALALLLPGWLDAVTGSLVQWLPSTAVLVGLGVALRAPGPLPLSLPARGVRRSSSPAAARASASPR
ncbi:hypothetical protein EV189_0675 [Motilibacter rhizosphaerae]|uniref:DUF2029 domain-containing protein n=1 Tax=Motilibacter rhizosphaerae TaxID=598652 RepID=A0A4Q7NW85_9ACTN|nr:hypothetical protein [Motilibacter rhizosphaerae]RZS91434.1 hypothetical protein EV189_0675 [Motilibacter rhizosphaerae]